jgi:hypothetical protein
MRKPCCSRHAAGSVRGACSDAPSEGHPAGLAGRPTPDELRSHALALHALAERFDRKDTAHGWLTDLADELHQLAQVEEVSRA